LAGVAKELDIYVEWSVNEKVAFEIALGASVCGVRAMAVMKHVGVNVAHDPLMTASYMGAKGGLVLVSVDDPGQWSSQNEQDNRYIAAQGYIPVLEPSSVQEAKDMTVDAFKLSEEFNHIFMLRSVTRVSHARGDVVLGKITEGKKQGNFAKDPLLVCVPAYARKNRKSMVERLERIKQVVDTLHYNQLKLVAGAKLGIIACGISYGYALEAVKWLRLDDKVSTLKIGTPYPLPEELVKRLLDSVSAVLVVEELEPFVENGVNVIAQKAGMVIKIHGKDVVPLIGELSTRKVVEAIMKLTGAKPPVDFAKLDRLKDETAPLLPLRPPALCPGCPHRAAFYAINMASRRFSKRTKIEPILPGDIGCYGLGFNPPLNSDDIAICMGGAFGIANGLARVVENPIICHLGDSTFFHSGIPPMINAVYTQAKIVMVVLDNLTTAMTGFQPHPGTGYTATGDETVSLKPERIAKACGVKFVEVVDPFDLKAATETIEKAIRFEGPAVIVCRRLCTMIDLREKRKAGEKIIPYYVDPDKCNPKCDACIKLLGCPAIIRQGDKTVIDAALCTGCGICAQVCPYKAIIQE
jgi:indolepyruvate ferredoxin oxidoreductase alpha subunit